MMKLIPVFPALFLVFACNQKQNPQQTNNNAVSKDSTQLISSWQVKGCAEKATKADTKFPAEGEYNDYPDLTGNNEIKQEGDSIVYSRFVHHGCCRKAVVSTQQQANVITITEYWTGQICKCMCNSSIRAVIRKLPKGEYRVYAIETGTDPVTDTPHPGKDTVMQQIVTIK